MSVTRETPRSANRLLAALSVQDFARASAQIESAPMVQGAMIYQVRRQARYVWFPHEGLISVVARDQEGKQVEVGSIGCEGMTGAAIALGGGAMVNEAMVQIRGQGSRMSAEAFRGLLDDSAAFKAIMLRYVLASYSQFSQNSACYLIHRVAARCARWLLTAHDRVEGDTFPLTQDYLATMLGVTRPTVSAVAAKMQRDGLIRNSHGRITVLDRSRLEDAACECYRIIEDEFERLAVD